MVLLLGMKSILLNLLCKGTKTTAVVCRTDAERTAQVATDTRSGDEHSAWFNP